MISENTMGYLTKVGATRRLLVNPNPGTGRIAGMVSTGSTPLTGATITLNRGYASTTTPSTGLYTISSAYAITYEVRASCPGYQTQVKTIQVTPNVTAAANFNLTGGN